MSMRPSDRFRIALLCFGIISHGFCMTALISQSASAADRALVDNIAADLTGGGRVKRGSNKKSNAIATVDKIFSARIKRGRNLQDESDLYQATQELPKRDFEIAFEYNSSVIVPQAAPLLEALGEALSRDQLKGTRIIISGHTDQVGSWSYNKKLSQSRADAVAQYLIDKFKLAPENLYAVGYSFDKLKNSSDPRSADNRRVEVINGGVSTQINP